MAVLNVRVEDIRDKVKQLADTQGITISEYVRDLLMEAIVPVHKPPAEHGDEPAPETMRIEDRQALSMLHRILAHLQPDDADYQLKRAQVIESGLQANTGKKSPASAPNSPNVTADASWTSSTCFALSRTASRLKESGTAVDERSLEFQGFDHNDGLEGHMASYVKYLLNDGRWAELQPQRKRNDNGNSHHRILDTYMRMLAEFRRIMDSGLGLDRDAYLLSKDELERIAATRVHPSNRHPTLDHTYRQLAADWTPEPGLKACRTCQTQVEEHGDYCPNCGEDPTD